MLCSMLPEDIAKEIRDHPLINTAQKAVEYLHGGLSRYNDKHLSTVADSQGLKDLETGPRNPFNAIVAAEQRMTDMYNKFGAFVAAFNGQATPAAHPQARPGSTKPDKKTKLPKPGPGFRGCWHCGKTHQGGRRRCPEFRELIRKSGGYSNPNLTVAYELHMEKQGKTISMIVAQADAEYINAITEHDAPSPSTAAPAGERPEVANRLVAEPPSMNCDDSLFACVEKAPMTTLSRHKSTTAFRTSSKPTTRRMTVRMLLLP